MLLEFDFGLGKDVLRYFHFVHGRSVTTEKCLLTALTSLCWLASLAKFVWQLLKLWLRKF